LAEHILHDYADDLSSLTLVPSSGGVFEISLNGKTIFSKERLERFPKEDEVEDKIGALLGVNETAEVGGE